MRYVMDKIWAVRSHFLYGRWEGGCQTSRAGNGVRERHRRRQVPRRCPVRYFAYARTGRGMEEAARDTPHQRQVRQKSRSITAVMRRSAMR
jgi:hypothetical protein